MKSRSSAPVRGRARSASPREAVLPDVLPEESLDRLMRLASTILRVPVTLVSLIEGDQQIYKSAVGLPAPWPSRKQIPLSHSFCKHAVASGEPLIVEDARKHPLLKDESAISEMNWIAYAGIPLRASESIIGTFCAIDHLPRTWVEEEIEMLMNVAALAASFLVRIEPNKEAAQPTGAEEVLDQSEPHFRSLIENTWDIICVLNADGAVRSVSPSVERVLGYRPAEIIGRNGAEIVHPDDRFEASQALAEGIQHPGENRFLELRLRHKDDSWHTLEIAGKAVPDHAGAPIGIISAHDITKRTQAEAALRESEERYRLVARATSDVIWDWDVTTGTLLWNDAGPKVFRYAAGEIGTTIEWWYENLHPEDRERVVSSIHAIVDGISEFWSEEYRFRRGDGAYATVLDRGYVVRNEKGGPVRMIGSMMDITERKRVEEAQRFLARASTLLDASLDSETILASLARLAVPPVADYCLIDMVEESGEIHRVANVHADPEKEKILLTDERWQADADMKHHPVVSVLRTGRSVIVPKVTDSVLKTIAPDPKYRKALQRLGLRSFVIVPLIARERVLGAITLAAAESGRHYNALDVMLAEDLAHRAALAVDNARLYREAQQAVRARDEMLAVVSHDLRNPLNGITMGVSLLLDTTDERRSTNMKTLRLIKRSAEQMNHLIQDLLDVSKIEAGRFSVDAASHSVASLMTDTGELFQPLVSRKKIRLESEIPVGLPVIYVDQDRILQVFSNLIGNAIKFTPEGGVITIRAELLEAEVCFSVADTGSGIPAEQLPHVFDRYWQAKRGDHRGAGLGLTIAKGIVEAHGGRVWVESAVEEGTTFFFTVPVGSD